MAGHSSPGLIPPPFPSTHAGWAASTVATLSSLLPLADEHDARDIQVEVGLNMSGGRELSQGSAAEGRIVHRNAVRRIVAPGTPRSMPVETIQAALQRDPITLAYLEGGILLDEQVVIG